ncbi:MAG TPA: kelch repeat-containing protein [Polyangiaceae bacterium]|jgi:hypothetical protein
MKNVLLLLAVVACGARTEIGGTIAKPSGTCSGIVLFGGYANGVVLNDTWCFDGTSWSPIATSNAPTGRQDPAMASDGQGLVLYGGVGTPGPNFTDTWTWTPSGWSEPTLASPPPGRIWTALARMGSQVVMYGGEGSDSLQALDDVWVWSGGAWSAGTTEGLVPQARSRHAMASLHDRIVVFGGVTSGEVELDDTWLWGDGAWVPVQSLAHPAARQWAAMTTLAQTVVLFGGYGFDPKAGNTYFDDTWTWDGATWTQAQPSTSPPARYRLTLATLGDRIVLFGGEDENGKPLGDTWTWDGAAWTELHPAISPPPRMGAAMASP